MAYEYNDVSSRRLGFRSDEQERTLLDDITHAVEVLNIASERCHDEDMRTDEVFTALDYLSSIASRKTALMIFRQGLYIQHPEQRQQAVALAMRSIRKAVKQI